MKKQQEKKGLINYLEKTYYRLTLYLFDKKEVYIKNNLYFERTYHEDFGLMPFIIVNSKTMVSTPYFYYSYIQEENSIMRNNDKEKEKIKIKIV